MQRVGQAYKEGWAACSWGAEACRIGGPSRQVSYQIPSGRAQGLNQAVPAGRPQETASQPSGLSQCKGDSRRQPGATRTPALGRAMFQRGRSRVEVRNTVESPQGDGRNRRSHGEVLNKSG